MRFRFELLCALAAASICLLTSAALAGDYYTTVPNTPVVKIGPDATGATPMEEVMGKEYSHTNWFAVLTGLAGGGAPGDPNLINIDDHDAFGTPDPLQVVSFDGIPRPDNSGSVDAFDFSATLPDGVNVRQIDALANHGDFLFRQVTENTATLLFSVTGDIADTSVIAPGPGGVIAPVAKSHIHFEAPAGGGPADIWSGIEAPPAGPGAGPGVNHHVVEDLDALEVWGPEPPSHNENNPTRVIEGYLGGFPGPNTADADRFSLDRDSSTGVSVWGYDIATAAITPYIPHADIVKAVASLFYPDGVDIDPETAFEIDVDATMVRDLGTVGRWEPGDELLFSIDPFIDFTTGALMADGGEIMHLRNTPGGLVNSFLFHGGHLWDTAFDVAKTFGYFYEDVDALEAVGTLTGGTDVHTPEPGTCVLLGLGAIGLGLARRRRDTV